MVQADYSYQTIDNFNRNVILNVRGRFTRIAVRVKTLIFIEKKLKFHSKHQNNTNTPELTHLSNCSEREKQSITKTLITPFNLQTTRRIIVKAATTKINRLSAGE